MESDLSFVETESHCKIIWAGYHKFAYENYVSVYKTYNYVYIYIKVICLHIKVISLHINIINLQMKVHDGSFKQELSKDFLQS